jgi:hypothetical protein
MTLTCTAILCEDEAIFAALTAVPACDARAAVALSSLFVTLITHTAIMITVARTAGSTFKLREAKPSIAAPVLKSKHVCILTKPQIQFQFHKTETPFKFQQWKI